MNATLANLAHFLDRSVVQNMGTGYRYEKARNAARPHLNVDIVLEEPLKLNREEPLKLNVDRVRKVPVKLNRERRRTKTSLPILSSQEKVPLLPDQNALQRPALQSAQTRELWSILAQEAVAPRCALTTPKPTSETHVP